MGVNVVDAEWRRLVDDVVVALVDAGVGLTVVLTPDPWPALPGSGLVEHTLSYHKGAVRDTCSTRINATEMADVKAATSQTVHDSRCDGYFGSWYTNQGTAFKAESRRGIQAL